VSVALAQNRKASSFSMYELMYVVNIEGNQPTNKHRTEPENAKSKQLAILYHNSYHIFMFIDRYTQQLFFSFYFFTIIAMIQQASTVHLYLYFRSWLSALIFKISSKLYSKITTLSFLNIDNPNPSF
jgi:hypothetical protein